MSKTQSSVLTAIARPNAKSMGALPTTKLRSTRTGASGAQLPQFKVEVIVLVAWMLLSVLGPLLVFAPVLAHAKRVGLREYGSLAQRYVGDFDQKWLRGGAPAEEALLGSADIQSLADLGNSFEVVSGMRAIPFTRDAVVQLAVFALAPLVPLLLTMISLEELLKTLVKIVL
jgi:hypothetical protein